MGRIFEINRNFRNEGADATHNPEFSALEAYQAYSDYNTMRDLARDIILSAATAVHGKPLAIRPSPDGTPVEIDLSAPWQSVTVHDAVSQATGEKITVNTPKHELAALCTTRNISVPSDTSAGNMVMALYESLVEKYTTVPTFYYDFPIEVSPLARKHRDDPRLAEQWDLVAFGSELGCAYTELTDPIDQRKRLTEQSMAAASGDPEAMQLDEDFLRALAYAMPPSGGLGLGVDRILMMLTGANIRGTLAFPFVTPHA